MSKNHKDEKKPFWNRLTEVYHHKTGDIQTEEESIQKRLITYMTPSEMVNLKVKIHKRLLSELDFRYLGDYENSKDDDQLRLFIRKVILEIIASELIEFTSDVTRDDFIAETLDEILGLSHLETFLRDPKVTEIMVNGPHKVFIEKDGNIVATDKVFLNDGQVLRIIEKIVSPVGRRIDESSPMVDARLSDGSRVNAIIPPLSLTGPVLTIRKFSKTPFAGDDLVRFGALSDEMLDFLQACVEGKLNILISGGTGSGKTTLLNVLSSFIPSNERVITIEDAAELRLNQNHVISLESRPPNIEGKGSVTIRDLVRNALRMRPDRIIIGEVRGAEALDMLQAMNTGHAGSLTTCHANSPKDALSRLETMVLMSGMELPLKAIRDQIVGAIDLIIQQSRTRDGKRKITAIAQVVEMKNDQICLQDLYNENFLKMAAVRNKSGHQLFVD